NWDGSGEKYGTAGEEISLSIRIFKIIYDIYYLKTHKEIVGVLTDEEVIELIRSESGKRYDPKLCECRLEEIL
ncbi:MAG: HD domain-containing phosphohydrolase, partial [Catonella sp.]|uniref:HD domain-containing phosphohydrolase n=1 Tax=Catonella sp. TaxID=2382125 RepID=UPI003F9F636A